MRWIRVHLSIKGIREVEKRNDVSVNVLGATGKEVYILRRSKYESRNKVINLLLIADGERRHYTAIKRLSRLLASGDSRHGHEQHFCINCLRGFPTEISRDKHSYIVKTMKQ